MPWSPGGSQLKGAGREQRSKASTGASGSRGRALVTLRRYLSSLCRKAWCWGWQPPLLGLHLPATGFWGHYAIFGDRGLLQRLVVTEPCPRTPLTLSLQSPSVLPAFEHAVLTT